MTFIFLFSVVSLQHLEQSLAEGGPNKIFVQMNKQANE